MSRLLVILIFASLFANAQDTEKMVPKFHPSQEVIILNLTSDNWTDHPSGIEGKPLRSRGFSFLIMRDKMNKKGNVGIGGGLGFMSQNVHTNAYLVDTGNATYLSPIPDSVDMDVNKLSTNYITAALELRLRSNEDGRGNRFKLSMGFLAGIMVQNHIKYEAQNEKYKTYDIPHLNAFQYGIMARIGYNLFAINGYYSLVPVFEDGKGPGMTPYSIGISLTI